MADLQFDNEEVSQSRQPAAPAGSGMTEWLVARGVASDARQAEYILIGVIVVCLLIAGYLTLGGLSTPEPLPPGLPF